MEPPRPRSSSIVTSNGRLTKIGIGISVGRDVRADDARRGRNSMRRVSPDTPKVGWDGSLHNTPIPTCTGSVYATDSGIQIAFTTSDTTCYYATTVVVVVVVVVAVLAIISSTIQEKEAHFHGRTYLYKSTATVLYTR